jgi:archaellum component FlaC
MRGFIVCVLFLAVGIGVTGYALGWFTVTGDLDARADFQKQAETRLKAMDLNLEELRAKAENGRAVTKERMNEAIANLNKKTEAARQELRELKAATPERWEALKKHLNTSLEELETGFEKTFSRFMNEWTHSDREHNTFFWQGVCT